MSGMSRRNGWTLGIVSVALFMVVLDNLVVNVALPTHPPRPRRLGPGAGVDRQRLRARLRRAAAHRRRARRPLRPQAHVRRSASSLFTARLGRRRARAEHRPADRRARRAGRRRRDRHAAHADAARRGLPARARGIALGVWSGISGVAVALGPLVGGAVDQSSPWHWIFWINVPIGLAARPARRAPARREPRPQRHARPARPRARLDRPLRHRLRPRPRPDDRLDQRRRCSLS